MDKEIMLKTGLFVVLMMLFPKGHSFFPMHVTPLGPRPLCASQFALVNRACALLPYSRGPPSTRPGQDAAPPTPVMPSPAPADHNLDDDDHGHGRHERHGPGHERHGPGHERHGPGHERRARHHQARTAVEEECCRWLGQVDDECVCDMLVRLPPFLARPVHEYTVMVADSCSVTFECASALIP